jgi:hypothetical protein
LQRNGSLAVHLVVLFCLEDPGLPLYSNVDHSPGLCDHLLRQGGGKGLRSFRSKRDPGPEAKPVEPPREVRKGLGEPFGRFACRQGEEAIELLFEYPYLDLHLPQGRQVEKEEKRDFWSPLTSSPALRKAEAELAEPELVLKEEGKKEKDSDRKSVV